MYKLTTKAKSHWSVGERELAKQAIEFAMDELEVEVFKNVANLFIRLFYESFKIHLYP